MEHHQGAEAVLLSVTHFGVKPIAVFVSVVGAINHEALIAWGAAIVAFVASVGPPLLKAYQGFRSAKRVEDTADRQALNKDLADAAKVEAELRQAVKDNLKIIGENAEMIRSLREELSAVKGSLASHACPFAGNPASDCFKRGHEPEDKS